MFTGIIENTGIITQIQTNGSNKTFWLQSPISNELKIDQSISHNGVCLTVEHVENDIHQVTAIEETLIKTNLNNLRIGDLVNLERCMQMNGRIDGHLVQGHVDATAICKQAIDKDGSWEYAFSFDAAFAPLIIEKGSICLNGISLTVFNVTHDSFKVAIIPYTYHHTNIRLIQSESVVNIELDIIGKYVQRFNSLHPKS